MSADQASDHSPLPAFDDDRPTESVPADEHASSQVARGQLPRVVVMGGFADTVEALLLSVARGDQEAFVALQSRMAGLVRLNVRRVLRDASRSEAATEETFAEVREAAVHFDPHRSSAETWLLTIAHQHAMDGPRSIDNTADPHHTQIARSASVSSP